MKQSIGGTIKTPSAASSSYIIAKQSNNSLSPKNYYDEEKEIF
jgi:hypothetical protein